MPILESQHWSPSSIGLLNYLLGKLWLELLKNPLLFFYFSLPSISRSKFFLMNVSCTLTDASLSGSLDALNELFNSSAHCSLGIVAGVF